jgi:uracil-DNA glycosylase family 4
MSEEDPRRELAGIVHGTRRLLERADSLGLGELLAREAQRASADRRPAAAAAAPLRPDAAAAPLVRESPASAPRPPAAAPTVVRDSAPASPRVAPAAPPEVDLFGQPVVRAAPAPIVEEAALLLPSVHAELNPGGWDARAAITEASAPVLDEIADEVNVCTKCGLSETRTNAVPGVGSARSGIVFVGEAPGADEDAQGEPFVGRAGQLLTRIIQAMEDAKLIPGMTFSRETVYICNVLKCRPPENRNPLPHEVETCAPYLGRQLVALKPRVICCLGKFAAELLLGVKGTIGGLRGKVYSYRGAKLIVTYHPAACLRNPGYKRPVWEDMQLLAREYLSD